MPCALSAVVFVVFVVFGAFLVVIAVVAVLVPNPLAILLVNVRKIVSNIFLSISTGSEKLLRHQQPKILKLILYTA